MNCVSTLFQIWAFVVIRKRIDQSMTIISAIVCEQEQYELRIYTGYIGNVHRIYCGSTGNITNIYRIYCEWVTHEYRKLLLYCACGASLLRPQNGYKNHDAQKISQYTQRQQMDKMNARQKRGTRKQRKRARSPTPLPLHPCPLQRGHLPWLMSLNPLVLMLTTVLLLTKARAKRAKVGQLTSKQRRSKGRLLPLPQKMRTLYLSGCRKMRCCGEGDTSSLKIQPERRLCGKLKQGSWKWLLNISRAGGEVCTPGMSSFTGLSLARLPRSSQTGRCMCYKSVPSMRGKLDTACLHQWNL